MLHSSPPPASPVTVDPTLVYSNTSDQATYSNNSGRLIHDQHGKQIVASVDSLGRLNASWSNNGGVNWSSALPYSENGTTPTWALDAANENLLHSVYRAASGGVKYQALTIARDASKNVTGITTSGTAIVLDSSTYAQLPSLTIDKNGRPAVAWSYAGTGGEAKWEVRFLRAAGDPAVGTSWKNAQGSSTSPDLLGQRLVAGVSGSASLQRMPAGTPNGANDDALYLFWQEDDSDQLRWSKATVSAANYAAWSAPTVKASVVASTSGVATTVDPRNRGIVVHYHNTGDERNRLYRKQGLDDSETTLWTATQVWGTQASLGVDRGDIYVYYKKVDGNIARLRYLPGPPYNGWETAETIIATATNSYPSMRQDMGNGDGNVAWARYNGAAWDLKAEPFPSSRPLINRFAVIPSAFDPSVGETATVSYFLKDGSPTLTVTVRVYDAQNALVRTLVNGSQAVGAQSVLWDGKNDAGALLPAGVYTVKGNATDSVGLEAPEATATARIGAINYSYDRLYRLTGVSGAAPATTYSYDPVGNRLSMVRGATTNYTYDRADRITTAGAVSYSSDAKGNVTGRGADSFTYDQPNRLTNGTIGGVASSYTYDGDGKRATRTSGGQTTSYTYDVNRSLPVVLDDGGRKYVWGLGLVYSVQGTSVEVYHADGLGSVRAVTDVSGDVQQTYTRDEFGVPTSTQGASNQPFGFTGEQRDPESGFMYLRARMYEPGIGRFLQKDPLPSLTRGTANWYTYVDSCPTSFADPSGLFRVDLCYMRIQEVPEFIPRAYYHTAIVLREDDNSSFVMFDATPLDTFRGTILTAQVTIPDPALLDCEPRVFAPGRPMEPKNQILRQFVGAFNATYEIPYDRVRNINGPNSNTFTRMALERLGYHGFEPSRDAPGWQYRLPVA